MLLLTHCFVLFFSGHIFTVRPAGQTNPTGRGAKYFSQELVKTLAKTKRELQAERMLGHLTQNAADWMCTNTLANNYDRVVDIRLFSFFFLSPSGKN